MQSIEKIRKANELTKVLKQHGFAEDSFEASLQAKSIMTDEEPVVQANVQRGEGSLVMAGNADVLQKMASLERSKHILNERVDVLQKELSALQEHFQKVVQRLDSAEARIRALRETPVAPPVHAPPQYATPPQGYVQGPPAYPQQAAYPQQGAYPQQPAYPARPGYGQEGFEQPREQSKVADRPIDRNNVSPNSVAIDKVFYFGKK